MESLEFSTYQINISIFFTPHLSIIAIVLVVPERDTSSVMQSPTKTSA